MIKIFRHYIFMIAVIFQICLSVSGAGHASAGESGLQSSFMLDMINHVRKNPLKNLADIGIDADEIIKSRPVVYSLISSGMAPLVKDTRLMAASGDFSRRRFDNEALNDSEVIRALHRDYGYEAFHHRSGWAGVMINNYISPRESFMNILRQMLENELLYEHPGEFVLLDPFSRDAGISFSQKVFSREGKEVNGYFLNIETASGRGYMTEGFLEMLVNQLRSDPKAEHFFSDSRFPSVLPDMEGQKDYSLKSAQPMAWNNDLYKAAGVVAGYIARHDSVDEEELSGIVETYLETIGFVPQSVDLVFSVAEVDRDSSYTDAAYAALTCLTGSGRLIREGRSPALLSPWTREMAFKIFPLDQKDKSITLVVVGIAAEPADNRFYVMGNVSGAKGGQSQQPSEDSTVSVQGILNLSPRPYAAVTDPLGRYQIRLPGLNLPVMIMDLTFEDMENEFLAEKRIFLGSSNTMFNLDF